MEIQVREHLLNFRRESYVTDCEDDKPSVLEGKTYIDCSLGINPFGYPDTIDHARKLFYQHKDINVYPGYPYNDLKDAIAEYWKESARLKTCNIKIGCGSIGIIANINKMFMDKGAKALGYCPQFTDFMVEVKSCNGTFDYIALKPDNNYRFDKQEMITAINGGYRLVYIDNPNNPTGQVTPLSDIEEIVKAAEKMNVCVLVDEAYGEYMNKSNSAISLVNRYENLLVTRSFSKGFGLAAYRVGYLVTGELIGSIYSKIDWPFAVSAPGQFVAPFALKDSTFLEKSRSKIREAKKRIIKACSRIKIFETDMDVPIMVLQHPDEGRDLYAEFRERGILTEPGEAYMELGKNCVRLRVAEEVDRIIHAVRDIEKNV